MSFPNDSESKLNKMTPYAKNQFKLEFAGRVTNQENKQPNEKKILNLIVQYPPCPTNIDNQKLEEKKLNEEVQQKSSWLSSITNWIYRNQKQAKSKRQGIIYKQQQQVRLFDELQEYIDSQQEHQREELEIVKARFLEQEKKYGKNPETYINQIKDATTNFQTI